MRILGIDYGDVRTGIAISDPMQMIATGLKTINTKDMNVLIEEIKLIIKEYNPEKIIIGYPKNMNGTVGPRAEKTDMFINELSTHTNLPVIRWDERLSSVMAHKTLHEKGKSPSRNKDSVDRIAACYILQSYLG